MTDPNSMFEVDGTIKVTNLFYKKLIRDKTEAALFTGDDAITRLEVTDFTDPSGNNASNVIGSLFVKTNITFSDAPGGKEFKIGEELLPLKVTSYLKDTSRQSMKGILDINASSSVGGKIDYTGDTYIRGSRMDIHSNNLNISSATIFGDNVAFYKELRIKQGGNLVIESDNVSIIDLRREVQITNELNVSNNGTGPALRVSQANPTFSEIMLLEASGLDVYSVGNLGNTQIRGKIRLGYDVLSSTTGNNVSNVANDRQGADPFTSYQLDVSGSCFVTEDINVSKNVSVNGTTYLKGLLTLQNDLTSYSDRRIKKNIYKLESSLDKIQDIHGYTYQRIDRDDDRQCIGLIAQEVEGSFPELVYDQGDIKTVNYQAFTSVLLECIHELKERITFLETKCLENKILN